MAYETIILEQISGAGIIRLNRPEVMNAVSEEMYLDLIRALDEIHDDENIRSVILTGSVSIKDGKEKQAFCAGADLKKHSSGKRDHGAKRKYIELAHRATEELYRFPKPVICAVNGAARGAGTEMALNCDFILMAEGATMAFPEIGLGTFVGGGVTWHLPQLVGLMKAKELVYTGRIIDAAAALQLGLALDACDIDELMPRALKLADTLAQKAPVSIKLAKEHLQRSTALDLNTALHLETDAILSCMDTEDWQEGIDAFMEKRKPNYKGK